MESATCTNCAIPFILSDIEISFVQERKKEGMLSSSQNSLKRNMKFIISILLIHRQIALDYVNRMKEKVT